MSNIIPEQEIEDYSQIIPGISEFYTLIDISLVKENKWNPNEMDAITFSTLKKSIKESGGNNAFPILVRKLESSSFYEIIDGAHRFKAMQELGFTKIVANIVNFSEKDARLKTLQMNELRGEFEEEKLVNLLINLENSYGVSESELYNLTAITPDESRVIKDSIFKMEIPSEEIENLAIEQLKNTIQFYVPIDQEDYDFLKQTCAHFKNKKFEMNFLYLCFFYINDSECLSI